MVAIDLMQADHNKARMVRKANCLRVGEASHALTVSISIVKVPEQQNTGKNLSDMDQVLFLTFTGTN